MARRLRNRPRRRLDQRQGRHSAGSLAQDTTPMGDKKQKPAKPGTKTVKK